MPITYNEQSREFHLYNDKISYLIKILANEQLGQLYFGKQIPDRADHDYLVENKYRPVTSYVFDDEYSFSLGNLKQEYPSYGTTDPRHPAFTLQQPNGSKITDFKYVSHEIYAGKKALVGLPATYVENNAEATTLEVTLYDEVIEVYMYLKYTIFEKYAAIARSVSFKNVGKHEYKLQSALSLNLDLPDADYEWLQFSGAWGRERHLHKSHLRPGIQAIDSTRGASSHMQNPFVILKRPHTTEEMGEALGISLVYRDRKSVV